MTGLKNLSFDGVLKTPPFLFVKTIEKVIRLCTEKCPYLAPFHELI